MSSVKARRHHSLRRSVNSAMPNIIASIPGNIINRVIEDVGDQGIMAVKNCATGT